MNSEELELSLRSEFENYLKDVFAGMQRDVADFQKNFEAEFEKHRSQMDDAFRNLSARFESDPKFDRAFTESVVEHLRLARDDGAQLSAQAFSDAQKLEETTASVSVPTHYDQLRDAINDISGQATQSAILKALVDHVAHFTPRGAFFIVKHDTFVCWRRFAAGGSDLDDASVREIHFPSNADTLLADAVSSMTTKDSNSSSHNDDSVYLEALGFDTPQEMFAVPLVARGRGVAVLYADRGSDDAPVNLEAIESLVRVAAITVELRAASAMAASQPAAAEPVSSETASYAPHVEEQETHVEPDTAQATEAEEVYESVAEPVADSTEFAEYAGEVSVEEAAVHSDEVAYVEPVMEEVSHVEVSSDEEAVEVESEYAEVAEQEPVYEERVNDFAFASSESYDASVEPEPEPVEDYAYSGESNGSNGHAYEAAPEPVVEVATAQPLKSRLSDRNVDLPIEVADGDERRLHNDARRFARLLVSEIKLYNEQKVNEGRDSGDLYDRLREAIDRSREMYDKRVKPEVAAKFDYFHYELVSNLAEGSDAKLGGSYPGANV